MSESRLPTDRHAIGQLLVRLLQHFRRELLEARDLDGRFTDIRYPHLQIWGNVGVDGIRLTELAARAGLGRPACAELVDELSELGYLERRPDPSDGRAKLIFPTPLGREVLHAAGQSVADLENRWRQLLAEDKFDSACKALDHVLRSLDDANPPLPPTDGPQA